LLFVLVLDSHKQYNTIQLLEIVDKYCLAKNVTAFMLHSLKTNQIRISFWTNVFVLVLGSHGQCFFCTLGSNLLKLVESNEQIVLYKTIQFFGIDLSFFRLQAVRVEVADHGVRALAFSLRGVAVGQWAAVSHLPFEGKLKKMRFIVMVIEVI
jgi:hypothetical protein